MSDWFRIVKCPDCQTTKEVNLGQKAWKCPTCKKKHEVVDTLWRKVKRG